MPRKIVEKRPDLLGPEDYIWNPSSARLEPVKSAYWSELIQRFVVFVGPLGMSMHTYGPNCKIWATRFY